jgi:hypothetical protein
VSGYCSRLIDRICSCNTISTNDFLTMCLTLLKLPSRGSQLPSGGCQVVQASQWVSVYVSDTISQLTLPGSSAASPVKPLPRLCNMCDSAGMLAWCQ